MCKEIKLDLFLPPRVTPPSGGDFTHPSVFRWLCYGNHCPALGMWLIRLCYADIQQIEKQLSAKPVHSWLGDPNSS